MKKYSKTFCVYPWMHQMTTPTGKVNFCCVSEKTHVIADDGQPVNLGRDSFAKAWNSRYMRQIRKKMVDGEPVSGCETCYQQEKIGKKSYRESHNEEWEEKLGKEYIENRVEFSIKNNFELDKPPVYLDLRLGNLCNLKCRMCNPYNSVMIEKEWRELDIEGNGAYSQFWKKHNMVNGSTDSMAPWYESDNFWDDVKKYIPHLKKVYMTGGEPTLIESNYKFLNTCRDMGVSSQIELFFNINFTTMKDRFIEQLKDFKWTSINASLDGYAKVNEYIRGNSKWEVITRNIEKLLQNSSANVGLGFSPVIQIYNILEITDLLDYIEELSFKYKKDILIDFLYCFSPDFLDVTALPKSIKLEAREKILEWKERSKTILNNTEKSFFLKNSIESLVNNIDQNINSENPDKIKDFLFYTKTLDKKRNQSFSETFPQLQKMLYDAGY